MLLKTICGDPLPTSGIGSRKFLTNVPERTDTPADQRRKATMQQHCSCVVVIVVCLFVCRRLEVARRTNKSHKLLKRRRLLV